MKKSSKSSITLVNKCFEPLLNITPGSVTSRLSFANFSAIIRAKISSLLTSIRASIFALVLLIKIPNSFFFSESKVLKSAVKEKSSLFLPKNRLFNSLISITSLMRAIFSSASLIIFFTFSSIIPP